MIGFGFSPRTPRLRVKKKMEWIFEWIIYPYSKK